MFENIFIPISKKQMLKQAFGSFIFLLVGLFFYFYLANIELKFYSKFNNPQVIKMVGLISIAFSIILLFAIRPKIFRNNLIGITLNQSGLCENSGIFPIGFIPWEDISYLQEVVYEKGSSMAYSSVLFLVMKDVDKFNNSGSFFRKIYFKSRWGSHSPIYIFNAYEKGFDEVVLLVKDFFEKYKK